MTREFTFERATKRTFRFREDDQQPHEVDSGKEGGLGEAIGVIYIQKHVFNGRQPSRIRVTVEEVTS